jgi:hypothetical protein
MTTCRKFITLGGRAAGGGAGVARGAHSKRWHLHGHAAGDSVESHEGDLVGKLCCRRTDGNDFL